MSQNENLTPQNLQDLEYQAQYERGLELKKQAESSDTKTVVVGSFAELGNNLDAVIRMFEELRADDLDIVIGVDPPVTTRSRLVQIALMALYGEIRGLRHWRRTSGIEPNSEKEMDAIVHGKYKNPLEAEAIELIKKLIG